MEGRDSTVTSARGIRVKKSMKGYRELIVSVREAGDGM